MIRVLCTLLGSLAILWALFGALATLWARSVNPYSEGHISLAISIPIAAVVAFAGYALVVLVNGGSRGTDHGKTPGSRLQLRILGFGSRWNPTARIIVANVVGTLVYLLIGGSAIYVAVWIQVMSRAYRAWGANPPVTDWDTLMNLTAPIVLCLYVMCLIMFYIGHRAVGNRVVTASLIFISLALYALIGFVPFLENNPSWHYVGVAPIIVLLVHLGLMRVKREALNRTPATD